MRRVSWFFAVLALFVWSARAQDFRSFSDAAQDATGLVWTLGSAELSGTDISGALFSTDGSAWRIVSCPGAPAFTWAKKLTRLHDGDVLCVWDSRGAEDDPKLLLSRHRGEGGRLFAEINLAPGSGQSWSADLMVFESSRGDVWVLKDSRLWRVAPDGQVDLALQVTEKELTKPVKKDDEEAYGFQMLETDDGRIWLFGAPRWKDTRTLRQARVFDGKEWRTVPKIEGLPARQMTGLALKDGGHFWVALSGGGLFEIDVATLRAKTVAEPEPGSFRAVAGLRAVGGAMLVATEAGEDGALDAPWALHRTAALWAWRGGVWSQRAAGFRDDSPRLELLLDEERETLIPKYKGGWWKLPHEPDSAVRIDWRQGLRLDQVSRIFRLPNGQVFVLDFEGQGAGRFTQIFTPTDAQPALSPALEIFRLRVPMIQDEAGVLWQIPLETTGLLRHYDGIGWSDLALPNDLSSTQVARLAVDSFGRVWLLPDDSTQKTACYNRAAKTWQFFKTLDDAWLAQRPRRAEFHLDADWLAPCFSSDGRIAFSHPRERLHYFTGKKWRSIDGLLGVPKSFREIMRAEIYPFFNRPGRLAWNYSGESGMITRELNAKGEWQQAEFEDNPHRKSERKSPLPRGAITAKPASFAQDRLGTTWLVWQHRLYRALPGVCVPIFGNDQAQPFDDSRSLDAAFVTGDGEVFLLTDGRDRGEYLHLQFDAPPPDTRATFTPTAPDAGELKVETETAAPRWFRWRLDAGNWSEPLAKMSVALEALPNGEHRCEVAALDRWLRADPTPAVVMLTVGLADAERFARLLAQLEDGDFARRETAVRLLAQDPKGALPALRAARAAASPEARWWIDAAMQEAAGGSIGSLPQKK